MRDFNLYKSHETEGFNHRFITKLLKNYRCASIFSRCYFNHSLISLSTCHAWLNLSLVSFFPPHSLRSHPAILKIPNELFYKGELQPWARKEKCISFCQWEHLPKKVMLTRAVFLLSLLPFHSYSHLSFCVSGLPFDLPWSGRHCWTWCQQHLCLQHGRGGGIEGILKSPCWPSSQKGRDQNWTRRNWHHCPVQKTGKYVMTIIHEYINSHWYGTAS